MLRIFADRAAAAFLLSAIACTGFGADAAATLAAGDNKRSPSSADSAGRSSKADAPRGAGRGGGGPGPEGGGPRTASVVLGAADVYRVQRGTIEAGLPIAGDLRPIETATVRSRIDGVLQSVAVREGQEVAAGALLARFESVEQESALRSAEADRTAAKSDFETQQWNYDQSKELFKLGAIAERDLRTARQAADAAQARLAASEARYHAASNVLRDTRVVAPFKGTIEKRKVQGGENTQRGAEMFTLVRSDVLELTATLPARRASEVKAGLPVRFAADSRQFAGHVSRVSPTIDPASRSITVYIQIANPKGELKGNTFATGQIIAHSISDALVVPQAAVRSSSDGGRSFAYRIEAGELAMAPLQLGVVDDARALVEVTDGLKEGDDVVLGNPGTLGRGMKVQLIGSEGRGGRKQRSVP